MNFSAISECRVCGSSNLEAILSLGDQVLSGVFPLQGERDPIKGPLQLVLCATCTLVQLRHSFPAEIMYGDNYGYRSGLNTSMIKHLTNKARTLFEKYGLNQNSVVLDIGSNDGTLLNELTSSCDNLYGMDPTSKKFAEFYQDGIVRIETFFTKDAFLSLAKPADLIFSISMFYDLEDPISFVRDVSDCLTKEGIWHFEMSYLPSMIDTNSFDTICHEHVEYYSLSSIEYILKHAGMKVVDIELNEINGGSIAVTAAKVESSHASKVLVEWLRQSEIRRFGNFKSELAQFAKRVEVHQQHLLSLLQNIKNGGASIWGVGASTKGNVLLQSCGIDLNLIDGIADVNPFKYGRETPGTRIPIKSEEEMLIAKPDYAIVLPWHFKSTIIQRSEQFTAQGGKLIFPLPMISFF